MIPPRGSVLPACAASSGKPPPAPDKDAWLLLKLAMACKRFTILAPRLSGTTATGAAKDATGIDITETGAVTETGGDNDAEAMTDADVVGVTDAASVAGVADAVAAGAPVTNQTSAISCVAPSTVW